MGFLNKFLFDFMDKLYYAYFSDIVKRIFSCAYSLIIRTPYLISKYNPVKRHISNGNAFLEGHSHKISREKKIIFKNRQI